MYSKFIMISSVIILLVFTACKPEIESEYLKTFTGDVIYSYLQKDTANYSEFVKIIDKSGLNGMLSAYGQYTCLAPTNQALKNYYKSKGEGFTFSQLSDDEVLYLAQTHILKGKIFLMNMSTGSLGMNMNDRQIDVKFVSDGTGLQTLLNDSSKVLEKDIDVYNGVIQKIDKILSPSTSQLSDFIIANKDLSIFAAALRLTGMSDSLTAIKDDSYIIGKTYKDEYNNIDIPTPPARKFAFTALVEPDAIFKAKGINSINDLIEKAKQWYPTDSKYDTLYTNRNNSLNQFISYHLIEKKINSNQFFFSQHASINADLYEYIETMLQYRLIRSSNERAMSGTAALLNAGSKSEVYVTNTSKSTLNGVYHYLSDILVYTTGSNSQNYTTNSNYSLSAEEMIRSSRVRFDYNSLLPEMMNNNLRLATSPVTTSGGQTSVRFTFPPDYFKYLKTTSDTKLLYLGGSNGWVNYQGDEMMGQGNYDITVRLMPVPPGTYELRFAYSANNNRSVTQIYVDNVPVGIPLDLRIDAADARIGWVDDTKTEDNGVENDKTMRNRGYMKGPVSYGKYDSNGNIITARSLSGALRRIVGIYTFNTYEPHYIRFKSVMSNANAQCMMDYFEYVPKNIYAPPGGAPESRD